MNAKPKYKTKQREVLLRFFELHPAGHVTAQDVCEHCRAEGLRIGQSTVYRQLERLVDEGLVNKYVIDATSPACFEYVAPNEHAGGEVCFHCKCEQCGKLIHLHCEELETIGAHLKTEHGFSLDPFRTVFYGLCADCAAGRGASA